MKEAKHRRSHSIFSLYEMNRQIHTDRKQFSDCQELRQGIEWRMTANGYGFLFGVMKMFWDYSVGGWYNIVNILKMTGTSMAVHCLRLCLSMQGIWVQSLVRELRCLTFLPPPNIPKHKT